jgi:hypothetical protein
LIEETLNGVFCSRIKAGEYYKKPYTYLLKKKPVWWGDSRKDIKGFTKPAATIHVVLVYKYIYI